MPIDIETIRRLSPAALRIFKEQTLGRARVDPEYSRLVSMPELADIFQGRPTPTNPPLWQKGLQTFGAPFRWISQNITEPFGAIATSPFTPSVPGTENLPWFQRERAEYEQWQEPEFTMPWGGKFRPTKGIVETLPWFAIPGIGGVGAKGIGGVGAKGIAGALGRMGQVGRIAGRALEYSPFGLAEKGAGQVLKVAGKGIGKAISKKPIVEDAMGKTGQWALPSDDLLNTAYKQDNLRKFAQWSQDKPIIGNVMRILGGERGFIKAESQFPEDVVKRAVINRARLQEIGVNMQGANMPRLTRFGNPIEVLRITEDGIVQSAQPLHGVTSRYLNDILENPTAYKFATPEAEQYIKEFALMRKDLSKLLEREGLKQSDKVHRIVKGIVTEDGKYIESKFGSDPSLTRIYETQEEAALAHLQKGQKIVYGVNPNEIMQYEFDRTINRIARKRFADTVGKLGKTAKERFSEIYPEKAREIERLGERQSAVKNALGAIQRVISYKGTSIPGATIAKIQRELPEMAQQMTLLHVLKPPTVEKMLSQMSRELRTALKTDPKELNFAVKTISDINIAFRDKSIITMMDVEDAIKNINLHSDIEAKLITTGYKETAKANRQLFKDFLTANRDYLQGVIEETKNIARPLRIDRYKFLQGYAGRERLPHVAGEVTERPFNRIPEFRGKFFDDKVVTYLEQHYSDEGNKWIRTMGNVSAMSRNLTAVLDDSAPFIQGLFTFGRNPLVWAKSTIGQLEFLVKPENFVKYMAKPENQALHAEMVKYGSSIQRFEIFEALPQIQKLAEKIPAIGGLAGKVTRETYGRAEAAFTGFGQLARDNLWKSLRRPNMTDPQLQELARTLDLMTGNLSTKAMGIGATQRDLESAFGLFSPRFTRGSLAYIGDVFKGGLAGAEARKGVAGLMAAGSAMYLGVSKSLGQEPDFDPRSARFMTIKVGNDYVGIGGMFYSLARLGGNLASVDNPVDLLKLDRFDNPFIKFIYGKSAPLTGLMVGAFEQKDYMGQPFENIGDWAKFLAEKVIPFSAQPLLQETPPTATSFVTQFFGARQFPKSAYELRDEARQIESQSKYGVEFTSLTKLDQNKIDKLPSVQKLSTRIKEEGRETPESLAWDNWNKEGEQIEETYRSAVTLASRQFDAIGDGKTFKDKVDGARSNRRALFAQRAQNPQYASIQEYFSKPKSPDVMAKMNPLDVMREEYYNLMFSTDMYDQYGDYNFDLADQKERFFIQRYGQRALDYVEEYTGSKWDEPANVKLLNQARNILEPYFQIESQVWASYPPELRQLADQIQIIERIDKAQAKRILSQYPFIVMARKQIALMKKQLKTMNPDIANALRMFYSY